MALGKRRDQQVDLFVPTHRIIQGPGHPFYSKLDEVLREAGFDCFAEEVCAKYYKEGESIHGHMNAIFSLKFSADGRRLITSSGGREAVKLWDVDTRQELLTLSGIGSTLDLAQWAAGGDAIIAGPPWQVWRAPSWEDIAAAEASEKVQPQPGLRSLKLFSTFFTKGLVDSV
jgi:WD40 repeat protein